MQRDSIFAVAVASILRKVLPVRASNRKSIHLGLTYFVVFLSVCVCLFSRYKTTDFNSEHIVASCFGTFQYLCGAYHNFAINSSRSHVDGQDGGLRLLRTLEKARESSLRSISHFWAAGNFVRSSKDASDTRHCQLVYTSSV